MSDYEFEKRLLINKDEYETLLAHYSSTFPNHIRKTQTNYYFDTVKGDVILEQECLRIRTYQSANKKAKLTYKIHNPKIKGDEEISQELSMDEELNMMRKCILPNGQVKAALLERGYDINTIVFVGEMKTERFEIYNKNTIIVLDKNTYSGKEDYNIEVESSSLEESEKVLRDICKEFTIHYRNDESTKSQRAIQAYKNKWVVRATHFSSLSNMCSQELYLGQLSALQLRSANRLALGINTVISSGS